MPPRRFALHLLERGFLMSLRRVLAACIFTWPLAAFAQSYPSKPIRLVVPFPPAGATDILSRELARQLSDRLKQQVIVDNRPGASGTLGSDLVAKSAADGYTIRQHRIGNAASKGRQAARNCRDVNHPFAVATGAADSCRFSPRLRIGHLVWRVRPARYACRRHTKTQRRDQHRVEVAEFLERLRVLGYDAAGGTPADFAKVVATATAKWARLIKERKITIE